MSNVNMIKARSTLTRDSRAILADLDGARRVGNIPAATRFAADWDHNDSCWQLLRDLETAFSTPEPTLSTLAPLI